LFSSEEIHNIKYIEIAKKIIKDGKIEDIKKEIKEENKIKEKEKIITNLDIKKINFAFIPNKFKIEQNDNKIDI
jgi:ribonucleotide reductase beta subunit family protein with ferritin-like domain